MSVAAVSWVVKLSSGIEREFFSEVSVRSYVYGLKEFGKKVEGKDFVVEVRSHCIFDSE
jgi:hypothetical protein